MASEFTRIVRRLTGPLETPCLTRASRRMFCWMGGTTMPIKSKAQRRKFAELLVKGEISPETFEEWNRGAGSAELPERLHPKSRAKPKRRRAKAKRKRTA